MLKGILPALFLILVTYCYSQNSPEIDLKEQPMYTSLKKALRHSDKVYKLSLENSKLDSFPRELLMLKELRVLLLDSNGIKIIPPWIKDLKKLRSLSLSYNQVRELPPELGSLSDLTNLYLDHNQLTELPSEFFYLSTLERLFIDHNKLTVFPPNFQQLKNLYVLAASSNEFEKLPLEIGHLYSLEKLSLSENHISSLPETFCELTELNELFLDHNGLTALPDDISRLKNLEMLVLDSNKLTSLPAGINELYSLKKLYINNNKIAALPAKLSDLTNLKILNLGDNPVHFHNDINQLPKLEYLYAENITYDKFPQELFDLQNNGTKIVGLKGNDLYNVKLLLSRGKNHQVIKEYDAAIQKYQMALKADTNNAEALSGIAACYVEKEKYDSAEAVCKRAMTKNPNAQLLKDIKANYTLTQLRTNKYEEMVQSWESKLKSGTSKAADCFELGKYYYDNDKIDDAEKTFQRALQMDPRHADSHFYLAAIALVNNKKEAFIFSSLRFLSLAEPGIRTETMLPFLFKEMKMRTGFKTKGGRSTTYNDRYILRGEDNEIVYKSANPLADLLVAMLGEIQVDEKDTKDTALVNGLKEFFNSNKTNAEIFQKELRSLCDTKAEDKKKEDDFYWNFYLPYFSEMISSGNSEAFSYLLNKMRRDEDYISAWLGTHQDSVERYKAWNKNYK